MVQEIQQKGYSCNAWSSILFFSAGRITGALQSPRSKSRFVTAKFSPRQQQCSPVSALGALYRSCKLHLCRKAAGSHEVSSSWFNPLVLSKLIYLQIISISPSRFHSWCAQMGTWWGTSMTHSLGSVSKAESWIQSCMKCFQLSWNASAMMSSSSIVIWSILFMT